MLQPVGRASIYLTHFRSDQFIYCGWPVLLEWFVLFDFISQFVRWLVLPFSGPSHSPSLEDFLCPLSGWRWPQSEYGPLLCSNDHLALLLDHPHPGQAQTLFIQQSVQLPFPSDWLFTPIQLLYRSAEQNQLPPPEVAMELTISTLVLLLTLEKAQSHCTSTLNWLLPVQIPNHFAFQLNSST